MQEIKYEINYSKIKNVYIQIKDGNVIVKAPRRVSKKEIEKIIESKKEWIKKSLEKEEKTKNRKIRYSNEEFEKIVKNDFNELILLTGLKPEKVTIKPIKYAWGSCSSKKNITININLNKYSEDAIKYVILHELCHLKYMNHSKQFWELLEKYMPNYKEIKREFKE